MTLPPATSHRILIISDAWLPQVNGVVRTLTNVVRELRLMGHTAEVIGPACFRTMGCPTYPQIPLALFPRRRLIRMVEAFRPDALHIATEGPLGYAARRWARRSGRRFTTSFHTRFPEYINARTGLPPGPVYSWLRRFHDAGEGTMVAAPSLREELRERGFAKTRPWSRGVDLEVFQPEPPEGWELARPVLLYAGRVAVEKNIEAFLELELPGSKVVVGDGPALAGLRRAYPSAHFAGPRYGASLARAYAGADVLVFPSLTDTFGLVLLEALACGTPIAAYPVTGPKDVLSEAAGFVGAIDQDLRTAALRAVKADRAACRAHAQRYSWRACAELFLSHLVPMTDFVPNPESPPLCRRRGDSSRSEGGRKAAVSHLLQSALGGGQARSARTGFGVG